MVSRLLDPMWVMAAISILGAYRYGLHTFALWRIIVFMIGVMLVPLFILRIYFSKRHQTSGWDIKLLKHRPLVIGVLLLFGALNIVIAWTYGNPALGKLFIFYELWLFGFFFISLAWKMSGHAGGIALATGLIIMWYGWDWWPALLLVPLMGWARVVTKNHTVAQVIAGTVYSWGLLQLGTLVQLV
ncbi:MAG: hypothetical protein Q8L37_07795 [Candidatus Gottesmanbacteria bacterium]|nr:hypothetical protein [Candidatus Gottesmanbacteria bacterium]